MKKFILSHLLILTFLSSSNILSAQRSWAPFVHIEYKSYAANLGYGLGTDYMLNRFSIGAIATYSNQSRVFQSTSRNYTYTFDNFSFGLRGHYLFGKSNRWEAGLSYTLMLSQVDYYDSYPSFYLFKYKGNIISQYAGAQLGYRWIQPSGLFFRPALRAGVRTVWKDDDDAKTIEYYNGYSNQVQATSEIIHTYFTVQLSVGFVFGKKAIE